VSVGGSGGGAPSQQCSSAAAGQRRVMVANKRTALRDIFIRASNSCAYRDLEAYNDVYAMLARRWTARDRETETDRDRESGTLHGQCGVYYMAAVASSVHDQIKLIRVTFKSKLLASWCPQHLFNRAHDGHIIFQNVQVTTMLN